MAVHPTKAMVLAAGLGLRMRPLTDNIPKPLVRVAGQPLLDHVLDKLGSAGVTEAVVNVHYLPDQIIEHTKKREHPRVIISDERDQVLGTGGGVVKALPLLGDAPFFHVNADTMWIDGVRSNLARLAEAFDASRMELVSEQEETDAGDIEARAANASPGGAAKLAAAANGALLRSQAYDHRLLARLMRLQALTIARESSVEKEQEQIRQEQLSTVSSMVGSMQLSFGLGDRMGSR